MHVQDNIVLDVNEDDINQLNRELLATLLCDRTTRKNILYRIERGRIAVDTEAAEAISRFVESYLSGLSVKEPKKAAKIPLCESTLNQLLDKPKQTISARVPVPCQKSYTIV